MNHLYHNILGRVINNFRRSYIKSVIRIYPLSVIMTTIFLFHYLHGVFVCIMSKNLYDTRYNNCFFILCNGESKSAYSSFDALGI